MAEQSVFCIVIVAGTAKGDAGGGVTGVVRQVWKKWHAGGPACRVNSHQTIFYATRKGAFRLHPLRYGRYAHSLPRFVASSSPTNFSVAASHFSFPSAT